MKRIDGNHYVGDKEWRQASSLMKNNTETKQGHFLGENLVQGCNGLRGAQAEK